MSTAQRLHETIAAACPIVGVRLTGASSGAFDAAPGATGPQIAAGNAALAGFDWSAAAHDAWLNLRQRSEANSTLDASTVSAAKLYRATAAVLVDEINLLRQWLVAFKVEVAAAATLADLKTRVAGLPNMPDRTLAQAKTAITSKINGGGVD